jgi:regulatory protein
MSNGKRLNSDQAFQKARHYCAYQERCHSEVKEKLYGMGLYKNEVEELISKLIEEQFLNEERFAIQFAGGKFRMLHWGRKKILYALKQKQVSEYCIKKALKTIDAEDYEKTLHHLAEKKWNSIKEDGTNRFECMAKTTDYLLQKGYEHELIKSALTELE